MWKRVAVDEFESQLINGRPLRFAVAAAVGSDGVSQGRDLA